MTGSWRGSSGVDVPSDGEVAELGRGYARSEAAWTRGRGLNDGGMTAFTLSEAQRDEVRAAARQAAGTPLAELTPESFPLPTAAAVLRRLAREVTDGAGFALLRGVPVDDDPDLICAGVGSHAGTIAPQGAGHVPVQRVRDQGADPRAPTTRSYQHRGAIGYHADPADIVALLCIRPAKSGGLSSIVRSAAVHDELARTRPDLAQVLYQPWWRDMRTGDGPDSFRQSPVYARDERGRLSVSCGPDYMRSAQRGAHVPPLSPAQREAMAVLAAAQCVGEASGRRR
ncbi:MAG: TauD/TfdA family dioxygenase [Actinomycetia bacterium]|nr:TauD/TfdA family dioxygenase [Actinomycetes bacterium]